MPMTLSYIEPFAAAVTTCAFRMMSMPWLTASLLPLLNLNPTKCKYMITRKRQAILPPTPLTVMGNTLDKVSSVLTVLHVGLDRLCSSPCLLFYSLIPKILIHYALQFTYYAFRFIYHASHFATEILYTTVENMSRQLKT